MLITDAGQPQKERVPLITVAMPIYNAGRYLRQSVCSILHQSETSWELLIIDDGSTDHALESIRDITDERIKIVRHRTNKGLAQRLNEAIEMAAGKYFARMDHDDVSYPERFSRQLAWLRLHDDLDLVATRAILINDGNQAVGLFPPAISHEEICARPWRGFYFPHPSWMGKTAWFRRHHYNQSSAYLCEDQELLLRTFQCSRFFTVDEILLAYRISHHPSWRKLARTHWALLCVQVGRALQLHQWRYIAGAVMMYAARTCRDTFRIVSGRARKIDSNGLSADIRQRWQAVRALCESNGRLNP